MARLFAGVDGGSTKTLAVLGDEAGRLLAYSTRGPSNYHVVGLDTAIGNIGEAISESLSVAGFPGKKVKVAVLGLAGMDTKHDFRVFEEAVEGRLPAEKVYVKHDAEIALVGATGGEPGIIVISGTGSVAGGRNRRGEYARSGGWGYIVGDEGSAYYLGIECLRAVLWEYDGRGEATKLTPLVISHLGLREVDEIVRKVYVEGMSVKEVAALAPLVTAAAEEGDSVAKRIVDSAAWHLAKHATALAERLGLGEEGVIKVAPVGGVFRAGRVVIEPFKRHIASSGLSVEIISPRFPPAVGALMLAYMLSGIRLAPEILANVENSSRRMGLVEEK